MIEAGDYVTTTTGHSGKIRSICSDDFIVIQQQDSQCYVCSRNMIIGEENTDAVPEEKNTNLNNSEISDKTSSDIQTHDTQPEKPEKKTIKKPKHSHKMSDKQADNKSLSVSEKESEPIKNEHPVNTKEDNISNRERTERMSIDNAFTDISDRKERRRYTTQLSFFDLLNANDMTE